MLGRGKPEMAHQTDEYCSIERLREAVVLYEAIVAADWCAR